MAITKRPSSLTRTCDVEKFISGAPDAAHEQAPTTSRRKEVVSPSIDVELLMRFDARAAELGLSRAAAINLAMACFLNVDL